MSADDPSRAPSLPRLYEDEDVIVFDKPSGLPCHRGGSREPVTVVDLLRAEGMRAVHLAHRLDRATSGALLVARHVDAARALGEAFASDRVRKEYLALVRGEAPLSCTVEQAVPSDEGKERVPAVTDVERLALITLASSPLRERRYSLVRARPRTGRFHQVRRHLKHLGHPLVGDTTYGRSEHNRLCRERFGLARLALHASALSFPTLRTGAFVRVTAPLPDDLACPLAAMGFALDELREALSRP